MTLIARTMPKIYSVYAIEIKVEIHSPKFIQVFIVPPFHSDGVRDAHHTVMVKKGRKVNQKLNVDFKGTGDWMNGTYAETSGDSLGLLNIYWELPNPAS